ncbi:MAG: hypothetical protein IPM21_06855 [Acidobacteria bacterium]|nr:hypothetical protein [Acidobacteriota bacterium]
MDVNFNANVCDLETEAIAGLLSEVFALIEKDVSKEYGGMMQHLWIDFELSQFGIDRRPPFPFRFQRKVGGGVSKLTGLRTPLFENVGHYSVRPDFDLLLNLPLPSVAAYALNLIYASTSILIEKKKRLGGFKAECFRANLADSCARHGYEILR